MKSFQDDHDLEHDHEHRGHKLEEGREGELERQQQDHEEPDACVQHVAALPEAGPPDRAGHVLPRAEELRAVLHQVEAEDEKDDANASKLPAL